MIEREDAAGIDLGDLEILLESGDGGGQCFPGVDGEFELAGGAAGGDEDGWACWGERPLARTRIWGDRGWSGADDDVGLDERVNLLPFAGLPVGIGEDEAVGRGCSGDPEGEEFDRVVFSEDDRLAGGEVGEGLGILLGDGLEGGGTGEVGALVRIFLQTGQGVHGI